MEVQLSSNLPTEFKPIKAKGKIAIGYPAEEILRYANRHKIDLIIMATHGYSGIKRWRMGSVADKVLRASKIPVLLARAKISDEIDYDKWTRKTLLVPLDGSRLAESVLPHVEIIARQRGIPIDIVLLGVCEQPTISSDYPEASMPVSWEEHMEQTIAWCKLGSKKYLERIAKRLIDTGLQARSKILMGNPAEEIIKYTTRRPFNLIIMATHGRSGLSRWAYGSVADRVLRGSSCPIILVRPQSYKQN
jgi:nucleotide-binding universal stress UspA family protein